MYLILAVNHDQGIPVLEASSIQENGWGVSIISDFL